MGYRDFGSFEGSIGEENFSSSSRTISLSGDEQSVPLPDSSYIKDSTFGKEGMDLVLDHADGQIIVEGYFAQEAPPILVSPDGTALSPALVNSFMTSNPVYANAGSASDESPVGAVHEISGEATITRTDGTTEPMKLGTHVYQGDIIETSGDGAVNIMFIDETSLAVSEDARMAIDEYVFDPSSSAGVSNFSVLKGVFVYTSGLIGREDPDDVQIETPVGSIGIRGTIIAADVDQGEVTVVEGAIVLTDMAGNSMTLATQFETARFNNAGGSIENIGQLSANVVAGKYSAVSGVSGQLFSSIADSAAQEQSTETGDSAQPQDQQDTQSSQSIDQNNDNNVDGSVDQNGDGSADGTVNEPSAADGDQSNASDAISSEPASEPVIQTATSFQDSKFGTTNSIGTSTGSTPVTTGSTAASSQTNVAASPTTSGTAPISGTVQPQPSKAAPSTEIKALDTAANTDIGNIRAITSNGPSALSTAFDVNISPITVPEHLAGSNVALINSINGALGTITLNGPFASLFEFQRINSNSGYIKLLNGEDLDFETFSRLGVGITATNGTGVDTVSKNFTVHVTNVNEAPEVYEQASDMMFNAVSNSQWNYNFRAEFLDVDINDTMSFSFSVYDEFSNLLFDSANPVLSTESLLIGATGVTFSNGMMNINFGTSVPTSPFTIEVTATDSGGFTATNSYDFSTQNQNLSFFAGDTATYIASSNSIYSSVLAPQDVDITGNTNQLFFNNSNNSNINLNSGSYDNYIYLMNGNDEININAGSYDNYISGGNGNDTFFIFSAENNLFGEDGADRFVFDLSTDIFTEMEAAGGIVNGGSDGGNSFFINFDNVARDGLSGRTMRLGGDKLVFGDGTNTGLDFSLVNGLISNIEIINVTNTQSNAMQISYDDIFTMTDDRDTLIISGDSNDTLELDAMGEEVFQQGQIIDEATGDAYDLYFIDGVTLLVDADIAVTTV